ncbi:hypothetical protein RR46_06895 [Papilio xuthus]|uniref:Uncharacterized protein n=1 Tax=Papilio xuthus TaxID=66420 RepID=A0A194PRU0_PAPXU|nr:hypothetical protein RR46_06895 [Papilio xuthus]
MENSRFPGKLVLQAEGAAAGVAGAGATGAGGAEAGVGSHDERVEHQAERAWPPRSAKPPDGNIDLYKSGIKIIIPKNNESQNIRLNAITVRTSNSEHNGKIYVNNNPDTTALSVFIIKYEQIVDSAALSYGAFDPPPSNASALSSQPLGHPGSDNSQAATMQATSSNIFENPEATTSKANTSETNDESRKRSQLPPKNDVPKRSKKEVDETEPLSEGTFTITGHFTNVPETVTNPEPELPVEPGNAILKAVTQMAYNNDLTIPNVPAEVSVDVGDCPALGLDDSSNYSFALTEEEKHDSFLDDLMVCLSCGQRGDEVLPE